MTGVANDQSMGGQGHQGHQCPPAPPVYLMVDKMSPSTSELFCPPEGLHGDSPDDDEDEDADDDDFSTQVSTCTNKSKPKAVVQVWSEKDQ